MLNRSININVFISFPPELFSLAAILEVKAKNSPHGTTNFKRIWYLGKNLSNITITK